MAATTVYVNRPAEVQLVWPRGTDGRVAFTFRESKAGPAVDVSAHAFTSSIRTEAGVEVGTFTIDTVDAASGTIRLVLDRTATASGGDLEGDYLEYRVFWTDPSDQKELKIYGELTFVD